MAIKKMQINIEINTECDSPNKVKELILALMSGTSVHNDKLGSSDKIKVFWQSSNEYYNEKSKSTLRRRPK